MGENLYYHLAHNDGFHLEKLPQNNISLLCMYIELLLTILNSLYELHLFLLFISTFELSIHEFE